MNVLCLDQYSEPGGAQRCLLDLLPAISMHGWHAHVAAPGDGSLAKRALAAGATADQIHSGPYGSGRKTAAEAVRFVLEIPRLAGEIRTLIRRYDADLIYVNGPRVLPAAALATHGRRPMLFHAHSLLEGAAVQAAGLALRTAAASAVASCRFVARPLEPFCGNQGIRIVYNGVAAGPLSRRERGEGLLRIGAIGRISPEKGQAEFLRAARLLDGKPLEFVICGAPLFASPAAVLYSHELDALAKGLPVEFTGWTENAADVLGTLDLLVVPSTAVDATPRVILEAFAAGVPVMAFAAGGIPEIIEDGRTGFLVERRTPEALAEAIDAVLETEPCRLREVSERARLKVSGDFSLARYREQMLETMQAALRG